MELLRLWSCYGFRKQEGGGKLSNSANRLCGLPDRLRRPIRSRCPCSLTSNEGLVSVFI